MNRNRIVNMYTALTNSPNPLEGNEPKPGIYRDPGDVNNGIVRVSTGISGRVKTNSGYEETDLFDIAFTEMGNEGPIVAFLHGVPTNRRQWYPVQKLVAPFCRTVSFDMLGMGESSKPLKYGQNSYKDNELTPWDWINDIEWVDQVMKTLYEDEKFFFVADDWGGGILSHYAASYDTHRLEGIIYLDPIAFDGYPVNEIQAIGRAADLPDDKFEMAMGTVDQTIVQILKTMVHDPSKFNQYNLRNLMFPYVDVDYERSQYHHGEDASSKTLRLHMNSLRVLADRSAVLAPAQLLPYDRLRNPRGVRYNNITVPVLVLWGENDNMMPSNQIYRFGLVMSNTEVQIQLIPRAGHFAGVDQPIWVAEEIINFIRRIVGTSNLADIFLGYTGIWKGDEKDFINDMRLLYDIDTQ